MALLVLFQDIA